MKNVTVDPTIAELSLNCAEDHVLIPTVPSHELRNTKERNGSFLRCHIRAHEIPSKTTMKFALLQ